MAFDIVKLTRFAQAAIRNFARSHESETFYAFAVDASMLCLNSEERAVETLRKCQKDWERRTRFLRTMSEMTEQDRNDEELLLRLAQQHEGLDRMDESACLALINRYRNRQRQEGCRCNTPGGIQELRMNTGDWAYQGFAYLEEEHGFDDDLYGEHYDAAAQSEGGHAPDTEYAKAMTALIESLKEANGFVCLERSVDFAATRVDHNY